jgi:predicted protein tyrosine phosphatase
MSEPPGSQPSSKKHVRPKPSYPLRILFVCSKNQWRSPTGEAIYRQNPFVRVRSAGTSPKARHRVSHADIEWADFIFVMESKHRQRIMADFPEATRYREIHVLGIEDNYQLMDPELIDEIKATVDPILASKRE